ncbi:unnamed protein product [Spirodela intermedia]|uniref:Uncharacterized protein n=1 Tax=Spirodela intermedia TaxID=51605 RepID=A0ABN7E850_SPIIN|nr:unnamed protein product [Spirodela intermedia]
MSTASKMEVGRVLGSFILKSAQQEEALHHIWGVTHTPLSIQAARAPARDSYLTMLPTHLRARLVYQEKRSRPFILECLKMRLREGLEENQGLIIGILVPKISGKRLLGVHQNHQELSITRPKTSAQQDLCILMPKIIVEKRLLGPKTSDNKICARSRFGAPL